MQFPVFQYMPTALVLSMVITFTQSSSLLPTKDFHRWIIALSLFFSSQRSPNSLSLSAHKRSSSPSIIFAALHWSSLVSTYMPCTGGARTRHSTLGADTLIMGRIACSDILAMFSLWCWEYCPGV